MKKISILLLFFLSINYAAYCQISKGAILLGGTMSYNSYYYTTKQNGVTVITDKKKSYSINISSEYFISNHFTIRAGIGGNTWPKYTDPWMGQTSSEMYAINSMLYLSYYKSLSDNFFFFTSIGVNNYYSHGKRQNGGIAYGSNDIISIYSAYNTQIGLIPGIFCHFGKRFAASFTTFQIGYQIDYGKTQTSNGYNSLNETTTKNFYLGFDNFLSSINLYYLLRKGK